MRLFHFSYRLGAALMVLTIITGVIVLLMASSLALFSLNINQRRLSLDMSNKTFATLDGCAEEALQHLRHDMLYAGETLVVGDITCTVVVIGTDLNRTITITANSDYIKKMEMTIVLYPDFTVSTWQELST